MRRLFIGLLLVAVACSPGETTDSTTTSSITTTSTSTTVQAPTTTSVEPTTTAAPSTTSTTSPSTTTTSTIESLEGDWADQPLVTVDFGALGWWDGSEWVNAQSEGSLPIAGGEDYQVTMLDQLGMTSGGAEVTVCDPLELKGVHLEDLDLLGDFPGPYGVAISAPWQLQPHLFEEVSDDGTYAAFAAELLSDAGLDVADPVIKQVVRTDLEGDGVDEVLVVAEDVTESLIMRVGDYSIAFLRKVVQGEVQTAILEQTVVLTEDDRFAGAHSIGGAADLNGDAKMEILTNTAYFEGFGVAAWEYVNDDLGPVKVLETGCGV